MPDVDGGRGEEAPSVHPRTAVRSPFDAIAPAVGCQGVVVRDVARVREPPGEAAPGGLGSVASNVERRGAQGFRDSPSVTANTRGSVDVSASPRPQSALAPRRHPVAKM